MIADKSLQAHCEQPTQLEGALIQIGDTKLLVEYLTATLATLQALPSPYIIARRSLETTDRVTDADQGEGKGSPHSGSIATSDREAREAEQIAQELQVGQNHRFALIHLCHRPDGISLLLASQSSYVRMSNLGSSNRLCVIGLFAAAHAGRQRVLNGRQAAW